MSRSVLPAVVVIAILMCGINCFAERTEYKLQPTDVITITVHGQPDLTTKTRITADGYISFPLLGKVSIAGLTVPELEQKLKELLEKDYLVNAQVIAFIEVYNARQVSVLGEVKTPGKYELPGEKDMTLMQAIAMAGGFTKFADITKTKVMRVENGEKKTIVINVKSITEKGDKDKDITLQAEDIVVVPESFF
ncbi:MAG: polysaccharide export protein [Candidatus Omnitrophica bacterium]|nr:polysaccharide export protein [Candidatus Omnitrophota bacterium]